MARRRFFVPVIHHGFAELTGESAQHLRKVLRAAVGQRFELSDQQHAYLAEIESFGKDAVRFRILEKLAAPPSPVRMVALISLVKFDRFELAIEKATELGVETVIPVLAARTDVGLEKAAPRRRERWRRIAMESAQQARRLWAPEVRQWSPFSAACATPAEVRLFLEEQPGAPPLLSALPPEDQRHPEMLVALLSGPEGGWTDSERRQAAESGWIPVSLGPLVLRTETAVAAALALVSGAWQQGQHIHTVLDARHSGEPPGAA